MANNPEGVTIGTISGGIVNFGGANCISPISVTRTTSGAGEGNQSSNTTSLSDLDLSSENSISGLIGLIRRSLP